MKTWTVDEMLAEGPCEKYDRKQIEELWGNQQKLNLQQILELNIPAKDRMWVVWRPQALKPEQRKHLVEIIVERTMRKYALPHSAAWTATEAVGGESVWAMVVADWVAEKTKTAAEAEYQQQVQDTLTLLREIKDGENEE